MSDYDGKERFTAGGYPEQFFNVPEGRTLRDNIDTLNFVFGRALAILALLEENGGELDIGFRMDQRTVMDALNSVTGLVEQARMIVHASR